MITNELGSVVCEYVGVDINYVDLNNILINVDVVIDVPSQCSSINVYVFGMVDNSEI